MLRRRPPRSTVVFLVLALACGLAAAGIVRAYGDRLAATRPDAGAPLPVLMAARDLPAGTALSAELLVTDDVPSAFLPPGALSPQDPVDGRILTGDVAAGEIITSARLAGSSAGPVAALVPPGLRASIVPTDLPPDAVRPGDLVDVLAAFGNGQSHVESVAEGVRVAKVLPPDASTMSGTGPAGPSLVLVVDPATSEELAYAATFARIVIAVEPAEMPASPSTSGSPAIAPSPSPA